MRNKNLSKYSQNVQWGKVLRNQRKQTKEFVSNQGLIHEIINEYKDELKILRLKMNEMEAENYELIQKNQNFELKNHKNTQQHLRLSRNLQHLRLSRDLELKNEEILQLDRKYKIFENNSVGSGDEILEILEKEDRSFGGREEILKILDEQNFEEKLEVENHQTNDKSRVSREESFGEDSFGELLSDDLDGSPDQEEVEETVTLFIKRRKKKYGLCSRFIFKNLIFLPPPLFCHVTNSSKL